MSKIQLLKHATKMGEKYGLDLGVHVRSDAFEIAKVLESLEGKIEKLEENEKVLLKTLNDTLPYVGPFSYQSNIAKKLFNKITEISNHG